MKARCQALFVVLAVLLAAAVGWEEIGRRGRQPSRPATRTSEVHVGEKVSKPSETDKDATGADIAAPMIHPTAREAIFAEAMTWLRATHEGSPVPLGAFSSVASRELDAWSPLDSDPSKRALARVDRALSLARALDDLSFIETLDRCARLYLEKHGEDIASDRAEAARVLRHLVSVAVSCPPFDRPDNSGRCALELGFIIVAFVVASPDEWSNRLRVRALSEPDRVIEGVRDALTRLFARTRGYDAEAIIREALIAMGYPETQAKNFFAKVD
jgi:hypothetical protein